MTLSYERQEIKEYLIRTQCFAILLVGLAVKGLGFEFQTFEACFKPAVSVEHNVIGLSNELGYPVWYDSLAV